MQGFFSWKLFLLFTMFWVGGEVVSLCYQTQLYCWFIPLTIIKQRGRNWSRHFDIVKIVSCRLQPSAFSPVETKQFLRPNIMRVFSSQCQLSDWLTSDQKYWQISPPASRMRLGKLKVWQGGIFVQCKNLHQILQTTARLTDTPSTKK